MAIMWPGLYYWIQSIAWTRRSTHVSMPIEMICRRYKSLAHSVFNQLLRCIERGIVGWVGHVVTHKRSRITPCIVVERVSTHVIPATPLVDLTVLTDKKTVSDVIPTYRETKTNPCFCLSRFTLIWSECVT